MNLAAKQRKFLSGEGRGGETRRCVFFATLGEQSMREREREDVLFSCFSFLPVFLRTFGLRVRATMPARMP